MGEGNRFPVRFTHGLVWIQIVDVILYTIIISDHFFISILATCSNDTSQMKCWGNKNGGNVMNAFTIAFDEKQI